MSCCGLSVVLYINRKLNGHHGGCYSVNCINVRAFQVKKDEALFESIFIITCNVFCVTLLNVLALLKLMEPV